MEVIDTGYQLTSLTANDEMIEHSLPGAAAAWQHAATHASASSSAAAATISS